MALHSSLFKNYKMKKKKVLLLTAAALVATIAFARVAFSQSETCTADVNGTYGWCAAIINNGTTTGYKCDPSFGNGSIRCNK